MTSAILLAAGESSRMGRAKALLDWGGVPLIEYQARELAAAGVDDIVIVLGHDAEAVRSSVPAGARVVVNEEYRLGRASSLRAGASALADDAGPIVVLSVDQPRPRAVHEKLLASHKAGRALDHAAGLRWEARPSGRALERAAAGASSGERGIAGAAGHRRRARGGRLRSALSLDPARVADWQSGPRWRSSRRSISTRRRSTRWRSSASRSL